MKAASAPSSAALARTLSPLQLFAISFGSIVGIGWITLVGVWLQDAGPLGAVIGFALGCAAVVLIALAYAEVALLVPRAGAEVAYADAAFGRGAAFVVGWLMLAVYAAVIAFEMISVGWVIGTIWPELRGEVLWSIEGRPTYAGELLAGLVATFAITLTNIRAAAFAASGQVLLMTLKVAVSLVFIAAAFLRGDAGHLEPLFASDPQAAGRGILSVFAVSLLFYSGFNFLPQALEERAASVRARQVVVAMLASLLLAFAFYALVVLATASVLPREAIAALDLPAAAAFEEAFGSRALRNAVLLAGLLGLITAWNGTLFAAGRVALMLGRQQLLPERFGRVDDRRRTPVAGLIAVTLAGTVLGLCGRAAVEPIVTLAATCIPLLWVVVAAVALRLRSKLPDATREFRVPHGRLVFCAGLAFAVIAFLVAARDVVGAESRVGGIASGVWIALGAAMWIKRSKEAPAPNGELRREA